jgi:hypothetical protein
MQGLQEVDSLDELQSPMRDLMEEVKIDFVQVLLDFQYG